MQVDVDLQSSSPAQKPKRSLLFRAGAKYRHRLNRRLERHSLIPNDPVLDNVRFPWMEKLAGQHQMIFEEAQQVLRYYQAIPPLKDVSPDHARIAGDGRWHAFFLVGYGYEIEKNCARAPITAQLVKGIPGLNSAFFSILAPGAKIPRHHGVTKGIVTCHLGIDVPSDENACWIEVEDHRLSWKNGEWLIFDDTYAHEAANDTGQPRVILLIQVRRPLSVVGRLLSDMFIWGVRRSPFVQEARSNLDQWEMAYREAEANIRA